MVLLLVLGFPMLISLLGGTLVLLLGNFRQVAPEVVVQQMIGGVKPAALLAVPMFILAADLMTGGQTAERLLGLVESFVGHYRGGLAVTSAVACTLFGALSGSTQATVAAIGKPLRPRMQKAGYPDSFINALLINASDVALLIPPSIAMIVYGVVSGTSIGELFLAGIGPGLLILLAFSLYSVIAAKRLDVPMLPKSSPGQRFRAVLQALPALGLPVIVIGGIYSGFFSPSEAASMSVLYALILEVFVFRQLSLAELPRIALSTGLVTGVVFVLVGAGAAFSWVISFAQLPSHLISVLGVSATSGYTTIMLTIGAAYFVGCMFVDPIVVILILTPVFHPIAIAAGIDPVLVGVLVTLQVAIGSATPPFGCDIFTARAIFGERYLDVIRGTPPFICILIVISGLVVAFPALSLLKILSDEVQRQEERSQ